jgi:hypothetical protein
MRSVTAGLVGVVLAFWPAAGALAQTLVYHLRNPLPFTVPVRILGPGPGFPTVARVPGGFGQSVPIPYPGTPMRLQVRLPNGQWSSVMTLDWRPGAISLPAP